MAGSTLRLPRLPLWLDVQPANVIYSVNSFAAASLALYVSFAADLPRPYWAVLTVYITAQPLTGALRSKAVYRVIGTLLGAAAAVVLVPNLVDSPSVLSLALASWVGACLFISLLDRTPRAYIFMLAGYTAGIIGFPSVDNPGDIFDTAYERVEEITVGVLSATLIHSIFFPREVTVALNARIADFFRNARAFISAAIQGLHGPQEERERRSLAANVTELQILATHLPFDTSNWMPRRVAVRSLQDRFAMVLPLISALEDRLGGLRRLNAMPPGLDSLVRDVAAFFGNTDSTSEEAEALKARSLATIPPLDIAQPDTVWPAMLVTSAAVRLSEIVENHLDALMLSAFVRNPERKPARIDQLLQQRGARPLDRDYVLAALSAWAAMAAVLACCAIWIATEWPSGAVAAQFAAIFASFFASLEDPAAAISRFLFWVIVVMPITAFYLFAVLPAIDGYTMLVIALSPFYLVTGYMQGVPAQFLTAMPLIIGFSGALAVQETYDANFADFANTNLALIFGVGVALWSTQLFRSVGASWSAKRILKRGWEDLVDLAAGRRFYDRDTWTSFMLDRVGLLTSRLQIASTDLQVPDALDDLRVGINIINLQRIAWRPPELAVMLARLSEAYTARIRNLRSQPGPQLLAAIDNVIAAFLRAETPPPESRQICASLVGLRCTLYPDAPGYR